MLRPAKHRLIIFALSCCRCLLMVVPLSAESESLLEVQQVEGPRPFDASALSPELAEILGAYYEQNYPRDLEWAGLESLRIEGVVVDQRGETPFLAIRKKPDLHKVTFEGLGGEQFIYAYDGNEPWQLLPGQESQPIVMPKAAAADFIRNCMFGGHLLYPSARGKTVRLLGTVVFEGIACYRIEVSIDGGQKIEYALSKYNSREVYIRYLSHASGSVESVYQGDFNSVNGMSIPRSSRLYVDDAFKAEIKINRADANTGVMPWMFRPASEYAALLINPVSNN